MTKKIFTTMKKVFLTLITCLVVQSAIAQVPYKFNYQGVALNASNSPIANQNVKIRVKIYNGSAIPANLQYSEERTVTTDGSGLFDFAIGGNGASNVVGSISDIFWNENTVKNLEVEMDPTGGNSFISMGVQQLASVPFAIQSRFSVSSINSAVADSLALPFVGENANNTSFKIVNNFAGAGVAINGQSFTNNTNAVGVLGEIGLSNNAGSGVRGRAYQNGSIGVEGTNLGGIGVKGKATGATGTGILAENTNASGKALEVNGNLKIAGGNTNPMAGGVLTCDAAGNATWKNTKVAFKASFVANQALPYNAYTTISSNQNLDAAGNYNPNSAATNPNSFIAPIAGYYFFSANAEGHLPSAVNNINLMMWRLNINGSGGSAQTSYGSYNTANASLISLSGSQLVHLNAGDIVKLELYQSSDGNSSITVLNGQFMGYLLFADN